MHKIWFAISQSAHKTNSVIGWRSVSVTHTSTDTNIYLSLAQITFYIFSHKSSTRRITPDHVQKKYSVDQDEPDKGKSQQQLWCASTSSECVALLQNTLIDLITVILIWQNCYCMSSSGRLARKYLQTTVRFSISHIFVINMNSLYLSPMHYNAEDRVNNPYVKMFFVISVNSLYHCS